MLLLFPGCFSDEEGPDFNGKNLNKMDVYKFTLSDTNQSDFSLTELEAKSLYWHLFTHAATTFAC